MAFVRKTNSSQNYEASVLQVQSIKKKPQFLFS